MLTNLHSLSRSLQANRKGVASFEYGVLAAVVIVAVAAVGTSLSTTLGTVFASIGTAMTAAN